MKLSYSELIQAVFICNTSKRYDNTPLCEDCRLFTALCRSLDDFVVHISEIPHVLHVISAGCEVSVQHIEGYVDPCMP